VEEEEGEVGEVGEVGDSGRMDMVGRGLVVKQRMGHAVRQNSFMNSNRFSYLERGYGLSQEEKTRIIAEIISGFDLERYVNEFKEREVCSVRLGKEYVEFCFCLRVIFVTCSVGRGALLT